MDLTDVFCVNFISGKFFLGVSYVLIQKNFFLLFEKFPLTLITNQLNFHFLIVSDKLKMNEIMNNFDSQI